MTLTGRCLCGDVRYSIEGGIGPLLNCHCRFCRRAHGAAFATVALVARARLRWEAGEAKVRTHRNAAGARRFCGECGTRLLNEAAPDSEQVALVVASLDQEPVDAPVQHLNTGSKAPWFRIADDAPQFDGVPDVVPGR